MDIEVISDTLGAILFKNHCNVRGEAEEVDAYDSVPLHRAREAPKYHHDQPGGERLVQKKVIIVLRDRFFGRQNANQWDDDQMEVMLQLI